MVEDFFNDKYLWFDEKQQVLSDHDLAGVRLAWRQHERQLRRRQRDRQRCLEGLPDQLMGVGRQAGFA